MKETQETWVQSLGWEDPWEMEMQTYPVFLPGKFHGQRNPMVYSAWVRKELDTTEHARVYVYTRVCVCVCVCVYLRVLTPWI